ncbi:DUF551 domain-containing protein [Serratia marcescens]|uniref:DUF551 domain-containing protein n=1 Tax=Serratia marcescens TaxID=615 RepID=UPI003FA7CD56
MTLKTERLKWLHDAATELSATKLKMTMRPDELLVLTSELLANREAQPVYQCRFFTTDVDGKQIGEWQDMDKGFYDQYDPYCRRILYTAPPAPAVPEEMKRDPDADVFDPGFMNGWNACRAAMLAQPVSQRYTLPDGWIACSERVPDADGVYWCWFGKEEPSVIQQRVCIWINRHHEWCDSAVTHWMPLPVAPEGGNG